MHSTWEQHTTRGTPPLGVVGYSCVTVGNDLYYFGGGCEEQIHSLFNKSCFGHCRHGCPSSCPALLGSGFRLSHFSAHRYDAVHCFLATLNSVAMGLITW